MEKIKIAIVEKHEILRACLVKYLGEESQFEIVFASSGCMEFFNQLSTEETDVLVLSSSLVDYKILQALKVIHESKKYSNIKIVIYSNYTEIEIVSDLIFYGAHAILNKTAEMDEIVQSIKTVIKEPYFFNKYFTREILESALNNRKK